MKVNKYLRMFYAEPDDDAGTPMLEVEPDMLGPEPDVEPTPEPGEPETSEVSSAPTISMTAEDIVAAVRAAIPQQVAPAPVQKPPMTQAEIDKLMKKPEIDDAFIERFGNLATQKEALLDFAERVAAHAEARAQVHTYAELQRLQQQWSPQLQAVQEMQAKAREDAFYNEYPDLAKPELRTVVNALAPSILSSKNFASQKEAFDAVAKGAERVIQSHAPTFKLTPRKAKASNPNAIPVTTGGTGGGGGASQPTASRKGPPGIDLFQSLR